MYRCKNIGSDNDDDDDGKNQKKKNRDPLTGRNRNWEEKVQ